MTIILFYLITIAKVPGGFFFYFFILFCVCKKSCIFQITCLHANMIPTNKDDISSLRHTFISQLIQFYKKKIGKIYKMIKEFGIYLSVNFDVH